MQKRKSNIEIIIFFFTLIVDLICGFIFTYFRIISLFGYRKDFEKIIGIIGL